MNTQVQEQQTQNQTTRMPFKAFLLGEGFNLVSKVRANSNGYKYVTAMALVDGAASKTENIYLGTRYSDTVEIGDVLNIDTLYVIPTTNAGGEGRLKLTDNSGEVSAEKLAEYQVI